MAQNRDRNWQEREQQQGGGQGHRGGWQGGEEFGQGERGQQHGAEEFPQRGSWGDGRENFGSGQFGSGQSGSGQFGSGQGGWHSGGHGQQQSGDWGRMGRYGEEGGQGRGSQWGQGGNYRMDRDYGQSGWRGGFGGQEGQGGSRGSWGGGSGGYGRSGGYGGSYGGSYGSSGQQGGRGFWDKASDEVGSWFGDEDARRRREQDEHRGRGPKGYTRSDERIREDVNDRLTDDGWLDASDIEVQVSNCEVTLTGQVTSREEKRRAEDIIESVSGVKHVQNNLRVKDKSMSSGQTSTTEMGASTSGSTGSSGKTSTGR